MVDESTRIYHKIVFYAPTIGYSFEKIKKSFRLWSFDSKVSTLTLADAWDLTVRSTDAGTYKIDDLTFKLFSMI